MPQLHETMYGKKFFEHQLPELIKSINRLADAVEENNKRSENGIKFPERARLENISFTEK